MVAMESSNKEHNSNGPDGSVEWMGRRMARAWSELGKGPKRAILLGMFLSWVLWIPVTPYWGRDMLNAILIFPFLYWAMVFAGLWVYRGFKK